MTIPRCFQIVFSLLFILLYTTGPVFAADCKEITSLPATIDKPGNYCLKKGYSFSLKLKNGNAILVTADNVVLDLNGAEISNTVPDNAATAIFADQSGITVRNGNIRGFFSGIQLSTGIQFEAMNHTVENVVISALEWGIRIFGRGVVIRNNTVIGIGTTKYGLSMYGSAIQITGNTIKDVQNKPLYVSSGGIESNTNSIEKNTISAKAMLSGSGIIVNSTDVMVSNNNINNMEIGIAFLPGSISRYRDNLATGCTIPYTLEADAIVVDEGNNR